MFIILWCWLFQYFDLNLPLTFLSVFFLNIVILLAFTLFHIFWYPHAVFLLHTFFLYHTCVLYTTSNTSSLGRYHIAATATTKSTSQCSRIRSCTTRSKRCPTSPKSTHRNWSKRAPSMLRRSRSVRRGQGHVPVRVTGQGHERC